MIIDGPGSVTAAMREAIAQGGHPFVMEPGVSEPPNGRSK